MEDDWAIVLEVSTRLSRGLANRAMTTVVLEALHFFTVQTLIGARCPASMATGTASGSDFGGDFGGPPIGFHLTGGEVSDCLQLETSLYR